MITYSNKSVWPSSHENHTGEAPTLADIAVGLGRQVRFAGQTKSFYTVLCHSLVCHRIACEAYPSEVNFQRAVLLHDAHEAILSDVPTTWKPQAINDHAFELDGLIMESLRVEPIDRFQEDMLKSIDAAALAGEAHALGHARAEKYWPLDSMSKAAIRAYELTRNMVDTDMPLAMLQPGNAISALEVAFA